MPLFKSPKTREIPARLGMATEAAVRAVLAAPKTTAAVALVVMGLCVVSAMRLRLEQDVRTLIQGADPIIARQLQAISDFTAVDQLLVHIDGGAHPEELVGAATELVSALSESGHFRSARFEANPALQRHLAETLMPRRFLLDPRDPQIVLAPEPLQSALLAVREQILAPQGVVAKPFLLRDPLGSLKTALAAFSTAPGLNKLDVSSGRFFSKGGRSLLVVTEPRGNPFDGSDASQAMAAIEEAKRRVQRVAPHVRVSAIGTPRFALEAQQMVRADVHTSASMTLLMVIGIFVAFFRRPRLALVALPPLAFGACVAGGLAGLLGRPTHGIILAFAAACLGLSVDYTIHLLSATATTPGPPREALPIAARKIGGSLSLAAASTLIGMAVLTLSNVNALSHMAVLAMGAIIGAFVGNVVWVPILMPLLAAKKGVPAPLRGPWTWTSTLSSRRPRTAAAVCILLAGILASMATRTRLDGDLRNLDTRTANAQADIDAFTESFGDPTTGSLALVQAETLDQALGRAADVVEALKAVSVAHIISPTVLAVPLSTARARRQRWCDSEVGGGPRTIVGKLQEAGAAFGYRPSAFASFQADLEHLCSPAGIHLLAPEPALKAFEGLVQHPMVRTDSDGSVRLAVAFEANDDLRDAATIALGSVPGVLHIDRPTLNTQLVNIIAADLPRMAGWAFALVAVLLFATMRGVLRPVRALLPCLLGMVATLGTLAALDMPINLLNLCVFPLLAGLGIDYGILMGEAADRDDERLLAERAFSVTVAAATTLAGFGSLAIAQYNGIATVGRAVIVAVLASALFALVLTPVLRRTFLARTAP